MDWKCGWCNSIRFEYRSHKSIRNIDGLSSNDVTCIFEDSKGKFGLEQNKKESQPSKELNL
ncbi:MAG: hypothetical protein IPJ32_15505 [Sphingobacteriaceae bacterium]|nr:hypothetical protein [Sphingobacteriaceae bacterium]